jgi:hypothetical protein
MGGGYGRWYDCVGDGDDRWYDFMVGSI